MKVIKAGTTPTRTPEDWEGKEITCSRCGCVFQLEENDGPQLNISTERTPNGKRIVQGCCPQCAYLFRISYQRGA